MNSENKDSQWKELEDYLRKLNLEFHWRTVNMLQHRPENRPSRPPGPAKRGGISMSMNHEHTPSVLGSGDEPASPAEPEIGEKKLNLPERWMK